MRWLFSPAIVYLCCFMTKQSRGDDDVRDDEDWRGGQEQQRKHFSKQMIGWVVVAYVLSIHLLVFLQFSKWRTDR